MQNIFAEIKSKMNENDINKYQFMTKQWNKNAEIIFSNFPKVRKDFLKLVDSGKAENFLKLQKESDRGISEEIELIRKLDPNKIKLDLGNKDHFYAVLHLSYLTLLGNIGKFMWMNKEGELTKKPEETIFSPIHELLKKEHENFIEYLYEKQERDQ